jgi:hypothetical protein
MLLFTTRTSTASHKNGCIASGTDLRLTDIKALARTATIKLSYGHLTEMSGCVRAMSGRCPDDVRDQERGVGRGHRASATAGVASRPTVLNPFFARTVTSLACAPPRLPVPPPCGRQRRWPRRRLITAWGSPWASGAECRAPNARAGQRLGPVGLPQAEELHHLEAVASQAAVPATSRAGVSASDHGR